MTPQHATLTDEGSFLLRCERVSTKKLPSNVTKEDTLNELFNEGVLDAQIKWEYLK